MQRYRVAWLCGALLWAGVAAPVSATVQTEPVRVQMAAAVRAAVAAGDVGTAGQLFNQMVHAYLAEGASRPDPQLDGLLADIIVALGRAREALPVLNQALAATPAGAAANALHLQRAQVREDLADFAGAEADYRLALQAYASGTPGHRQAAFGLARVLLADKPAEAARLAGAELGTAPADSVWEGNLIRARAAAIAGDAHAARAALQRAWDAAPAAPIAAYAAPRIANDMALQAGLAGDREALTALSAISRAQRAPIDYKMQAILSGMPVCGTDGLQPEDWVVVELISARETGPARARLAYASRPGIGQPFLRALVNNPAFDKGRIGGPAMTLEMRCVAAVREDYDVQGDLPTLAMTWLIAKGAYPAFPENSNDSSTLARELARREARFGPNSIQLLPILLWQFAEATRQNPGQIGPALRPLQDIAERTDQLLNQAGAPADILFISRLTALRTQMLAESTTEGAATDEYQRLLSAAAASPAVSLDMIFAMASMPKGADFLRANLARLAMPAFERRAAASDPRRQALALRISGQDALIGKTSIAAALRQKAGFPADLCRFTNPKIVLIHQQISPDDVPMGARRTRIPGSTIFELDVSATGEAHNIRMILAEPPLLFDDIAIRRVKEFRYDPPRLNGETASCRGQSVTVSWRLPD